jgi:hypothetical protein
MDRIAGLRFVHRQVVLSVFPSVCGIDDSIVKGYQQPTAEHPRGLPASQWARGNWVVAGDNRLWNAAGGFRAAGGQQRQAVHGSAGRAVDAMVSHLDVFPTVCDLAGLPRPDYLEGRSLIPLLTGEAESLHDALFSEITFHAGYDPQRAVRTERYKLIKRFADPPTTVATNIDHCPSKDDLFTAGYGNLEVPVVELYDLVIDPLERVNRADAPAYSAIRETLEEELAEWMERTDDPLRTGPVPLPPGAVQDSPAAYNPEDLPLITAGTGLPPQR